jgi:hypothetical protein
VQGHGSKRYDAGDRLTKTGEDYLPGPEAVKPSARARNLQ